MKTESRKEEQKLFDQIHFDCCQCKLARRKISEAMKRIRDWFNKELRTPEPLPREFNLYEPPSEKEYMRHLWNRYL